MQKIELTGKYAAGEHRFALVDDADFSWLNQWRWKAKPNGSENNIYAVRNTVVAGRNVTIRMHRIVLGLEVDDPQEIDHIDHNPLNNTRANLRIATRSENILNSSSRLTVFTCPGCNKPCAVEVLRMSRRRYCSAKCLTLQKARERGRKQVLLLNCSQCGAGMLGAQLRKRYCSDICRSKAKRTPHVSLRERIVGVLHEPLSARDVSIAVQCNESDARRLLPELRRAGDVAIVSKVKGRGRGRPTLLYIRSDLTKV